MKVADFNNDTFLDLIVANHDNATTSILFGYGNRSFKSYKNLPNGIAIGDVNNDYRSDTVVVNRNTNNIAVFLGQGNGDFAECVTYSTGINSVPVALALGDFDSDTNLDLVAIDHHNNILLIFIGADDGKFQHTRTLSTGNDSGPYLVIVNDFNQDNYLDIAIGNGYGKYVSTYLGNGRGKFSELATYYSESSPLVVIGADINKDRILDFVTANRYKHDASGQIIIDPLVLDKYHVRYHRIVQNPNEFIVLSASAVFQSFTTSANWGESIVFALPSWIEEAHHSSST